MNDEHRQLGAIRNRTGSPSFKEYDPAWRRTAPALHVPEEVFSDSSERVRLVVTPGVVKPRRWRAALLAAAILGALVPAFLWRTTIFQMALSGQEAGSVLLVAAAGQPVIVRDGRTMGIKLGARVRVGDRFSSGTGDADLILSRHIIVRAKAGTVLLVERLDRGAGDYRLRLRRGRVLVHANRLRASDQLRVLAPHMQVSPRGTDFSVQYRSGVARLVVTEGRVWAAATGAAQDELVAEALSQVRADAVGLHKSSADQSDLFVQEYAALRQVLGSLDPRTITLPAGSVSSERSIGDRYGRALEEIELTDGSRLRGVTVGEAGGRVLVHTAAGLRSVPRRRIRRVRMLQPAR